MRTELLRVLHTGRPRLWFLVAICIGGTLVVLPLDRLLLLAGIGVATGVLLLIVRYPLAGLALALVAGPFGALENIILGGNISLDSGQILLLVTLAAWVARSLGRRHIWIPHMRLTWPLLAFIGVMGVTLHDAPSLVLALKELVKWVEIFLIALMVVDLGSEWETRQHPLDPAPFSRIVLVLLGMILLAGVSQALIGIWQFAPRGHGPEHFLVLGRFYRAYGTFEQPNPFGGYMSLNAGLAIGAALGLGTWSLARLKSGAGGWKAGVQQSWLLALLLAAAGTTTLALIMSWSRGAWLGFGAAAAALLFFWPQKQRWGVLMIVAAVGILVVARQAELVPGSVSARLQSALEDFRPGDVRGVDINDANYAVLERLAFWQAATDMARHNLWLGVGFGNYGAAYDEYALINWTTSLGHAHNYYLNILAEGGIIGFIAYLSLWAAVIWQAIALLRRLDWPTRGLALGLLAAWVALSAHHLVDKLYVNNIYVHLGAMLGLQQLLDRQATSRRST